jgi:crotonobetainyl-CoA:carnitine CoA-transferase CaiB-like acyl-CoA transferase
MLADLGADVLQIRSGAYLDPFRVVKTRQRRGLVEPVAAIPFTNRNKRGLALNLKSRRPVCDPRTGWALRRGVENFRRGVLDRAGLGYAALKEINRLVFAAISSQGDTGPERRRVSRRRSTPVRPLAHRLRG